uniref:hypothetical protein n=1 Tax=Thauera sp. SDU_THAU2 TaxID=3136633 RepID=UPI00311F889F
MAKTLSTTTLAPIWLASRATPAMSITSSVGLVGLSRKKTLVFLRTAPSQLARSRPSISVHSIPYFGASVSTTQRQEPKRARAATIWSPAFNWQRMAAETAAMPEAVARASSAPSSMHMRFSNMSLVGLP